MFNQWLTPANVIPRLTSQTFRILASTPCRTSILGSAIAPASRRPAWRKAARFSAATSLRLPAGFIGRGSTRPPTAGARRRFRRAAATYAQMQRMTSAKVCPAPRQRRPTFAGEPRRFFATRNRGSSRGQNCTREDSALAFASQNLKKISWTLNTSEQKPRLLNTGTRGKVSRWPRRRS